LFLSLYPKGFRVNHHKDKRINHIWRANDVFAFIVHLSRVSSQNTETQCCSVHYFPFTMFLPLCYLVSCFVLFFPFSNKRLCSSGITAFD